MQNSETPSDEGGNTTQTVALTPQDRVVRYDQFFDPHSHTKVYRMTKQSEEKRPSEPPSGEGGKTTQTVDLTPQDRIARYDQFFDPRSRTTVYRKTNKKSEEKRLRRLEQKKVAILARRLFDNRGSLTETKVEIRSPILRDVLVEIHKNNGNHELTGKPATCDHQLLYHSVQHLKERRQKEILSPVSNLEIISDIDVALTYIQEECGQTLQETHSLFSADVPSVTFNLLWTLFPFGESVYHHHDGTDQNMILRVRSFRICRDSSGELYGRLRCTIISNDGRSFGLSVMDLKIKNFDGTQAIENLSAFPLLFHRNSEAIFTSCVARGKEFVTLSDQSYVEICGQAIRMEPTVRGEDIKKFSVNGRVMIDPMAFRTFQPNSDIPHYVYKPIIKSVMTDLDYLICDPVVLGFAFGEKTWGGFSLERVRKFTWSDEAFNSLEVERDVKETIRALISQHASGSSSFDDIVKGKGKGLVGLLAGGPGCGKTLTAEAVAEISKRPLYNVSAGEIGTTPVEVDKAMQGILSLAQRWNAVVLLDEADVFMSKRSVTDINRNALVSIFLRQLEYYQGILFLTTNRAEECDAAFESRIHFTIFYPNLPPKSRRKVWEMFINKTGTPHSITDENFNEIKEWPLNGRQVRYFFNSRYIGGGPNERVFLITPWQIKNIVSVANACCLANKKSKISFKDIENAVKATSGWKKSRNVELSGSDVMTIGSLNSRSSVEKKIGGHIGIFNVGKSF
ncbi:P-loop containing nucleoside triphosphate hydrolase protein [Cyathus striatus]|nr:P-loop containing nucleoside triphosphate hydrolase protein [Cyathus striatus]